MTTIKSIAIAAGLIVIGATAASAHSVRPIDRKLEKQAEQIEAGRRGGGITWTEGKSLRAEQREIARARDRFLSDGNLSKREARILYKKQQRAAWHIVNEKNDARRRVWWLPRVGR